MTALEICLILIGIAAIVVSYFISEKVSQEKLEKAAKEFVLSEESKEVLKNQTRKTVENILEDMTEDIAGKAERELEKLSNEKIMAVQDYSNTVLDEINKNHNEVMFLYSMLDDKDKEIKSTVREIQNTVNSVRRLEEKRKEEEVKSLEIKGQAEPQKGKEPEEVPPLKEKESEEALKNNNERILKLHQEGKTNVQIARELGLGTGEVKLVIDLFQGVIS